MDTMRLLRQRPSTLRGSQLARRLLSGSWDDAATRGEKAKRLRQGGASYAEIAEELGVTRNQARWLVEREKETRARRARGERGRQEREEKRRAFVEDVKRATGLNVDSYYLLRRSALEKAVREERDPVEVMKEMGCWIEGRSRPPALRALDSVRAALMKRRGS